MRKWMLAASVMAVAGCAGTRGGGAGGLPGDGTKGDSPAYALTVYATTDAAMFDPVSWAASQNGWGSYDGGGGGEIPGYGVVRDTRVMDLKEGLNEIRITDVAERMDPTSVVLQSPREAAEQWGLSVVEQNFEFDLVNAGSLLKKYVDKPISVVVQAGNTTRQVDGVLLSQQGVLILKTATGIEMVDRAASVVVRLKELPAGLQTKPTLAVKVIAKKGGRQPVELTYQTENMTWRADYSLVMNKDDTAGDLSAWVTLVNQSGVTYGDSKLKLVAGDLRRVAAPPTRVGGSAGSGLFGGGGGAPGFTESPVFEYHMYTLGRPTDVKNKASKQVELFGIKRNLPVKKMFLFDAEQEKERLRNNNPQPDKAEGRAEVDLVMSNTEKAGLGIPLPRGLVRAYKRDGDGDVQFIGEDLVDHTPKDEEVLIRVGSAFDVAGARTVTNQEDAREPGLPYWQDITVTVRNHKDAAVKVIVREHLEGGWKWSIENTQDKWEKKSATVVHFPIEVPAIGEKTIKYRAKYWVW